MTMDPGLRELLTGNADDDVAVLVRRRPGTPLPKGVRVVAQLGDIASIRLPRRRLVETHASEAVASMKPPRLMARDRSPEEGTRSLESETNPRRRHPGTPETGAGVVIALADWGLDPWLPNFRHPDGSTRLSWLWNQREPWDGRNRYERGRVYSREEIDAALRGEPGYEQLREVATMGGPVGNHGTHVADIAAGRPVFGAGGVAPEAELVFVQMGPSASHPQQDFGDSISVVEAVHFMIDRAQGKPCVVNLSMGRHGGGHDGQSPAEQALDAAARSRPGLCIVQSAGNYLDLAHHASGWIENQPRHLDWIIDRTDGTGSELEVWYSGRDRFGLELRGPDGQLAGRFALGEHGPIRQASRVVGRAYHRAHDPNNGDHHIDIFLDPQAPRGPWRVTLFGEQIESGRFHAWVEREPGDRRLQSHFRPTHATPRATIGTIANGHETIVVGAYDEAPSGALEPAPFSSAGPTRDGRPKPDLVAPGVGQWASRSNPEHPRRALVSKAGTSMATPHVAGTAALMLQANPTLDGREIRRMLVETTRHRSAAAGRRLRMGAGVLDSVAAVALARDTAPRGALMPGVSLHPSLPLALTAPGRTLPLEVEENDAPPPVLQVADLPEATPSFSTELDVGELPERIRERLPRGLPKARVAGYHDSGTLALFIAVEGATRGIRIEVDLKQVATRIAKIGKAVAAPIRRYLTRSAKGRSSIFKALPGRYVRVWLSPGKDARSFAVFDLVRVVVGLAKGSYAGFQPVEANLDLGANGAAMLYRGRTIDQKTAFAMGGTEMGSFELESAAVRQQVLQEDGGKALWVTVFRGEGSVAIAIASNEDKTRGLVVRVGIKALVQRVAKALRWLGKVGRDLLAKIRAMVDAAGRLLAKLKGAVLSLELPFGGGGGGGSFLDFDLKLSLPKLILGGFDLRSLLPSGFSIGGKGGRLFSLPSVNWPRVDLGSFDLTKGLKLPKGFLRGFTRYLRGLGLGFGSGKGGSFKLPKIRLFAIDMKRWIFELSFDLSGLFPGGGKREFGFTFDFGAILRRIAGRSTQLFNRISALLEKVARNIAQRCSVGLDGVLRVLVGKTPDPNGARLGFDLRRLFDGVEVEDLVPVELHVAHSMAAVSYGLASPPATFRNGPPVIVQMPQGDEEPYIDTTVQMPRSLASKLRVPAKTKVAVQAFVDDARLEIFGRLSSGQGLSMSLAMITWKSGAAAKLFEMSPRDSQWIDVTPGLSGLRVSRTDTDAGNQVFARYRWGTVISIIGGDTELTSLVPDEFRIQRKGLGLTLVGKQGEREKLPTGGITKQVAKLPAVVRKALLDLGITSAHTLRLDAARGTLGEDSKATVLRFEADVYRKTAEGFAGVELKLQIDFAALVAKFLGNRHIQRLRAKAPTLKVKRPPVTARLENGMVLVDYRWNKKRETAEVTAGWTPGRLGGILLAYDEILDRPALLAPDRLAGKISNGKWTVSFHGGVAKADPSGMSLPLGSTPGLTEAAGMLLSPEVLDRSTLYLNIDTTGLAERAATAISEWEPLTLADAVILVKGREKSKAFGVSVSLEPKAVVDLVSAVPLGFSIKVVRKLWEFAKNPEDAVDSAFYTSMGVVEALRAIYSGDVDFSSLSKGDIGMLAITALDADMKYLVAVARTTRRLRETGFLTKADLNDAKKNIGDYTKHDQEQMREFIARVARMSDKQLRKLGRVRKEIGNDDVFNQLVEWSDSLPPQVAQELRVIDEALEEMGWFPDFSHLAEGFDPAAAAERVGPMLVVAERIAAAATAAEVMAVLDKAGFGPKQALRRARQAYDARRGKGPAPQSNPLERYETLTAAQLEALLRDGFVVVKNEDGGTEVIIVDPKHEQAVAGMLVHWLQGAAGPGKGLGKGPDDGVPVKPAALLAQIRRDARMARAKELARHSRLSARQIVEAQHWNPFWKQQHGVGPADFDMPHLNVASPAYAVFIADWQDAMRMRVDGIAGHDTVAMLKRVKGARSPGSKPGAKGPGGKGLGNKPKRAQLLRIPAPEFENAVQWNATTQTLELAPGRDSIGYWKKFAVRQPKFDPVVAKVELFTRDASRPGGPRVIFFQLRFRLLFAPRKLGGERIPWGRDIRIGRYVFIPDVDERGNHVKVRQETLKLGPAFHQAIDFSDLTDPIRSSTVRFHMSHGPVEWEIDNYVLLETGRAKGRRWHDFSVDVTPRVMARSVMTVGDRSTGTYRILRPNVTSRAVRLKVYEPKRK